MTVLFKYSMYFVSTVFAGKFICVQLKYNRILQQVLESRVYSSRLDSSIC